jgi:hypothetical protein
VRLSPKKPPGRLSRKALAFAPEIFRLHDEGHTSEAIRQALLDAGLTVSRSTVQREVARYAKHRRIDVASASVYRDESEQLARRPLAASPSLAFASDPRSSKEIAASFVKGRNTNPLLRSRNAHESSRH